MRTNTNVLRAVELKIERAGVLDDISEPPNQPQDCLPGLLSNYECPYSVSHKSDFSIACCQSIPDRTRVDKALFTWPISQGIHLRTALDRPQILSVKKNKTTQHNNGSQRNLGFYLIELPQCSSNLDEVLFCVCPECSSQLPVAIWCRVLYLQVVLEATWASIFFSSEEIGFLATKPQGEISSTKDSQARTAASATVWSALWYIVS